MAHIELAVTKLKDIRGRRITGYRVRVQTNLGVSACYADGKTELEAIGNIKAKLTYTLSDLNPIPTVFHYHGFTAIIFVSDIFPDSKGFAQCGYRLVWPDGRVGCETHGGTRTENVQSAETHIAQLLYADKGEREHSGLFTTDRAKENFESWAQWQDSYKMYRELGMSDVEAHARACGRPDLAPVPAQ